MTELSLYDTIFYRTQYNFIVKTMCFSSVISSKGAQMSPSSLRDVEFTSYVCRKTKNCSNLSLAFGNLQRLSSECLSTLGSPG